MTRDSRWILLDHFSEAMVLRVTLMRSEFESVESIFPSLSRPPRADNPSTIGVRRAVLILDRGSPDLALLSSGLEPTGFGADRFSYPAIGLFQLDGIRSASQRTPPTSTRGWRSVPTS